MFQRASVCLQGRLASIGFWQKHPIGLAKSSIPQMVNPHYFRGAYKRNNPDDPTTTLKLGQVFLKQCPACGRYKAVPIAERHHFHTCCEGHLMKERATAKKAMALRFRLQDTVRQWDFVNMRPWCNGHRPRPRGRSKLPK